MLCYRRKSESPCSWYSWWLVVLLSLIGGALANTETFLLSLRDGQLEPLVSLPHDGNVVLTRRYVVTESMVDQTNEFVVDLSEVPVGSKALLLFDVTALHRANYFVRACWSAIHPVTLGLSAFSIRESLSTAPASNFLAVELTPDYYSADSAKTKELFRQLVLQLTLSKNTLLFGNVSPAMLQLGLYVGFVSLVAVLFAFVIV